MSQSLVERAYADSKPRITLLEGMLLLIALLFWINYSLVLKLRLVDFLLMIFLALALPNIRMKFSAPMVLSFVFFVCYTVSAIYGILTIGVTNPNNFLFIYKYLIIFLLFCVLMNMDLHPQRVERLRSAVFFSYLVLVIYVFLYLPLRLMGIVHGTSIRVTFPFSNDIPTVGTVSDAPLYSVVLSTFLVGYLFYPTKPGKGRVIRKALVAVATVAGIILGGSRTGLLSLPITFGVYLWRRFVLAMMRGLTQFKRRVLVAVFVLIVVAVTGVLLSSGTLSSGTSLALNVGRAFSFGMDDSVLGRVTKTTYVLQTVSSGLVIFGVGMQSAEHTWIDNGYAAVILAAGFGGLLALLLAIFFFLRDSRTAALRNGTMRYYDGLEYVFLNWMVCCFTSEYFLVTRGLVPFALLAALYHFKIRNGTDHGDPTAALARAAGSPGRK